MQSAPLLAHYDSNKLVQLAVYVSNYGLGGVLSHISENGEEKPGPFASCTLSSTEQNYSMIEKEALVSSVPFWSKVYLADRSQTSHLHTWSKTWDSSPRCVSPTAMGYSAGSLHVQYQILCIQEPWNDDALSQLQRKTTEEIEDISKEGDQVNRVQIEHMQITGNRI